jgi:thiamine-monophosphate kinase
VSDGPNSEFELIRRYFATQGVVRDDVVIGIGDDGAVLRVPAGKELVVSIDTLVSGVHFPESTPARAIGHKALAVNLSDMAAMAADPAWATLALTLPYVDDRWLAEFSAGFLELASRFNVQLVGGDVTRGPLSITVQVHGFTSEGAALRRDSARSGDLICVTGTLGDAALGLQLMHGQLECGAGEEAYLRARLERPEPRVLEALSLRGVASAAIDISDGLVADLGHILDASGVGATLHIERLPQSAAYRACRQAYISRCGPDWWDGLVLGGGDDYELCFTIPADRREVLGTHSSETGCPYTCIGVVEAIAGLRCIGRDGVCVEPRHRGYEHFGAEED